MITAWSNYHLKRFDEAKRAILGARSSEKRDEFLATIAAYVDKDDVSLDAFVKAWPENLAIINAVMIRARDQDTAFDRARILSIACSVLGQTKDVRALHILNNAARALMARRRDAELLENLRAACGMLRYVIAMYPGVQIGPNWNHRAAAGFWLMKALWAMGQENRRDAIQAGMDAVRCWDEALKLDPTNEPFKNSRANLLAELLVINSTKN